MELDEIFDFVTEKMDGFPEIEYRFTTMHHYIGELSEFLEFTYAQKIQRLKAKIEVEKDAVEKGELEGELFQLEEQGMEYLSHTIWGGVLVSIFATYESNIQELFAFFERTQGKPKFKKEPRKSFIECAQNYSKEHLNISLYGVENDKTLLMDLSQLRNSYVHNGCKLDALPKRIRATIVDRKYKGFSLGLKDGRWVANAKNTEFYFKFVYQCFVGYRRRLNDTLFNKNA